MGGESYHTHIRLTSDEAAARLEGNKWRVGIVSVRLLLLGSSVKRRKITYLLQLKNIEIVRLSDRSHLSSDLRSVFSHSENIQIAI